MTLLGLTERYMTIVGSYRHLSSTKEQTGYRVQHHFQVAKIATVQEIVNCRGPRLPGLMQFKYSD